MQDKGVRQDLRKENFGIEKSKSKSKKHFCARLPGMDLNINFQVLHNFFIFKFKVS